MTRRVAILGLGRRGTAFARAFHAAGWQVTGFDPDPAAGPGADLGRDWRREATISGTVSRADWLVLCLPERIELLRKVIQRAQAEARDDAIVAVVTRDTDAEAVQGCALRPAYVLRVGLGEAGALLVDTTAATAGTVRTEVKSVLAVLAAPGALDLPDDADQPPAAESA